MPLSDRFALLRRIRYRVRRPRVLCLTVAPMDRQMARRLGIDEFVTVPVVRSDFVGAVNAVLGRLPVASEAS
jgi:DNA-binding response OmpR family regulator